MKKAIFLDRDGVINKAFIKDGLPKSPNSLSELKILPGVKESVLRLKKLNFVCLVVTNQPDVTRGKINKNTAFFIHQFIFLKQIPILFHLILILDVKQLNAKLQLERLRYVE